MRGIGMFSRWVRERTMEYTLGNWCSSTGLSLADARAMRSERKYMRKFKAPAIPRARSAPLVPPHSWPTPTNRAPRIALSTSVLKLLRMCKMVGRGEPCPNAAEAAKAVRPALRAPRPRPHPPCSRAPRVAATHNGRWPGRGSLSEEAPGKTPGKTPGKRGSEMSRRLITLLAVLLIAAVAAPAAAISDGELDGDGHPAVVLILMEG